MDKFNNEFSRNLLKYVRATDKEERNVVFDYMNKLAESGLVNMFQTDSLLYAGKRWITAYVNTKIGNDEDIDQYQDVIDYADICRDALIRACMKNYTNGTGPKKLDEEEEITDYVNRTLARKAQDLGTMWREVYGKGVKNLNETTSFTCSKCDHSWDLETTDPEPYTCHHCGLDNSKGSL